MAIILTMLIVVVGSYLGAANAVRIAIKNEYITVNK